MTDKQFEYWDNRITKLMKICKEKNLSISQYLDILDRQELKKFRNTKIVIKDLSPWVWVNHKFKWETNLSKDYDKEVEMGFEMNLLHND